MAFEFDAFSVSPQKEKSDLFKDPWLREENSYHPFKSTFDPLSRAISAPPAAQRLPLVCFFCLWCLCVICLLVISKPIFIQLQDEAFQSLHDDIVPGVKKI